MNGGFTWGILTDDPTRQEAAWAFISFWNSPEVQLARFQPTAQVPVRASTAEDPFYQSEFWQAVNEAASVGQTRPGVAIYPVMSQQLQQAVQAFKTGGATAEQAIDDAAAAVAAEHERQGQR
jgi:multiple sugar transport system substrate-binding protein